MTTLTGHSLSATPFTEPRPRRWTKDEYHQMGKLGWFADQRVELLDGEIVEMPNLGNPHCLATDDVAEILRALFSREGYWVRMQMPLDLGLETEPQPDVAVVLGAKRSFEAHPTSALLVVEVSDTTLLIDQGRKADLYARGGVPDYWIVDLAKRQVAVPRLPLPHAASPSGFRYSEVTVRGEQETLTSLAMPQSRWQGYCPKARHFSTW